MTVSVLSSEQYRYIYRFNFVFVRIFRHEKLLREMSIYLQYIGDQDFKNCLFNIKCLPMLHNCK